MATSRAISSSSNGTSLILTGVTCNSSIAVGDWVRLDASAVAQKAQADSFDNANVIGVVTNKQSATVADITTLGLTSGIFASLDPTKEYFLSPTTPGAMTLTVPSGAGQVILKVGQPFNATQFLVLKGGRIQRA